LLAGCRSVTDSATGTESIIVCGVVGACTDMTTLAREPTAITPNAQLILLATCAHVPSVLVTETKPTDAGSA
jgi:hypothetical protein